VRFYTENGSFEPPLGAFKQRTMIILGSFESAWSTSY